MKIIITFFLLFAAPLIGTQSKPPSISKEIWSEVSPYLLPENHPLKPCLDLIFSTNCIANGIALYKAGFRYDSYNNPMKVIVAKHPKLEGYIIKLFLDNQPVGLEWPHWIKRIEGAKLIKKTIEQKEYAASFKVPRKWIYFIPCKHNILSGRHFILIAEEMDIVQHRKTCSQWKNQATYEQIYMFWDLLETCGLSDSIYIQNIPYCKDGKYTFLDTEYYLDWPIEYHKFNKYLKKGKLKLWKQLTNQE